MRMGREGWRSGASGKVHEALRSNPSINKQKLKKGLINLVVGKDLDPPGVKYSCDHTLKWGFSVLVQDSKLQSREPSGAGLNLRGSPQDSQDISEWNRGARANTQPHHKSVLGDTVLQLFVTQHPRHWVRRLEQ
jgi:hypothetical protein